MCIPDVHLACKLASRHSLGAGPTSEAATASEAPDSHRTGLADPSEDWPAADVPAAQRSFRSLPPPP